MHKHRRRHLNRLLLLVVAAVLITFIGCQSFSRPATTADIIDYTKATSGLGFPQPQQQLLRYRDSQDVAAMRRHGWEICAAMTQPTPSGFPTFLTWYQVSDVFGQEPGRDRRLFAPEFRVPSQKTLGDGDAILSFNVYNAPLRDHLRQMSRSIPIWKQPSASVRSPTASPATSVRCSMPRDLAPSSR
jgi:hypothetical protein